MSMKQSTFFQESHVCLMESITAWSVIRDDMYNHPTRPELLRNNILGCVKLYVKYTNDSHTYIPKQIRIYNLHQPYMGRLKKCFFFNSWSYIMQGCATIRSAIQAFLHFYFIQFQFNSKFYLESIHSIHIWYIHKL